MGLIINIFENIFSNGNNLEVQVDVCSFEAEPAPRGSVQPDRAAGQVLLQQIVDLVEKIFMKILSTKDLSRYESSPRWPRPVWRRCRCGRAPAPSPR